MFFAVLVASLALSIGMAIYDLVVRELQVSSTTEQSQYAIYAADSAAECALYWDFNFNGAESAFATSSTDTDALAATGLSCNGQDITSGGWIPGTTVTFDSVKMIGTTTTAINIGTHYAQLTVVKTLDQVTGYEHTSISADGYNTQNITSPNAVERELQVNY